MHLFNLPIRFITLLSLVWIPLASQAQLTSLRYGEEVSVTVRGINDRALEYLVQTQLKNGSWAGSQSSGSGVVGICVMAMMASGEDPDYGPYADSIRHALQYMIANQNATTGVASGAGHGPMYHHGFATLALSEAYGVVNEKLLWDGSEVPMKQRRSIGEALELAVRCAVTSQKSNPYKAWRYSPNSQDADTTVSGTVLMGLLGARNAGIEVPNESVEQAITYFRSNTRQDGHVSYQLSRSHGYGTTRAAIATLVYAIGKRKDTPEFLASSKFIKNRMHEDNSSHPFYHRYYMAQALFQSDFDSWKIWNQKTVEQLQSMQGEDGSFSSTQGKAYGTGMSVLALALNYRLLPVYER